MPIDRTEKSIFVWGGVALLVVCVAGMASKSSTPATSEVSDSVTSVSSNSTPAHDSAAKKLTPEEIALGRAALLLEARGNYAKSLDDNLLGSGIESTTTAIGPQRTTLHIKDALAGRARAKALGDNLQFNELKALGFKKVIYTNGFDEELGMTFTWNVNKAAD